MNREAMILKARRIELGILSHLFLIRTCNIMNYTTNPTIYHYC